ncbi:MAG TPA: hypothetical protein VKB84_20315 [Candidatus Binataceae bacterium]|nr:hypothetical protein [Candidatus Binataceae bacterium]
MSAIIFKKRGANSKMAPASETLMRTVNAAFTRLNTLCNECEQRVSELEANLIHTQAEFQRAQAAKQAADEACKQAQNKHNELLNFRGNLKDAGAQVAFDDEIRFLAFGVTAAKSEAKRPANSAQQCEQALAVIKKDLDAAKKTLQEASERRNHVFKQLQQLGAS